MLDAIYNYLQLSANLSTGGQPDEKELEAICSAGFDLVINLGLSEAAYAIANEAIIVQSYGLDYIHLPVSFEAPEANQFYRFCEIIEQQKTRKIFLHCAANKRVSVFIALYRVIFEGWNFADAEKDMLRIWEPDNSWKQFIETILSEYKDQTLRL